MLRNLANATCDEFDVTIAYAMREQTPANFEEQFDNRIRFVRVENLARSINPTREIAAAREIRGIIKDISPAIVHLHSSKAGVLGRWVLRHADIPVIYTPHGYSFLMEDSGWAKRAIYRMIERVSAGMCGLTVACSPGERLEAEQLSDRVRCVPNGIDTEALPTVVPTLHDGVTVYTIGRICYQKNPEMFNTLASLHPDIRFVWIGDGDMRDVLDSDNIEVTGWLERDKALRLCSDADVLLMTSRWEGLPLALLEGMAMGKAAIVSDVIGNRDVVDGRCNGWLCKTADGYCKALSEALSADLGGLSEEGAWRARNGAETVAERFTAARMAQAYSDIYKSEIARGIR